MRISSNKLKTVSLFAKSELAKLYDEREIQSFFYLLCEHFLAMDKTAVILNPDFGLSESELLKFNFAIKDLKTQKPIQYILGETEFFGRRFKVNAHTLIPRQETEELVKWIAETVGQSFPMRILDIGTGSGCIAISLSKEIPKANITAVDISVDALEIAALNNKNLEASVSFQVLDILNPSQEFNSKFDIIVSNPPYVLETEKELMQKNVLEFEPHQALFVKDNDPLLFYRKILLFAQNNLVSKGKIYFEINEKMGNQLSALMRDSGFKEIVLRNDLFEKARMICGTKK